MFPITILAGGRSSRMGRDKALIPFRGQSLLERTARLALQLTNNLLIVGRPQPPTWPDDLLAKFLDDPEPRFAGPMPAIRLALRTLRTATLLLPCDMPLLTPALLRALYEAHTAHSPTPIATLATHDNRAEPLLAIYTPQILPAFDESIAAQKLSLQPCLSLPGVLPWPVPPQFADQLLNLNDPATLARLQDPAG